MPLVLGYWNIRGRTNSVRLILHHTNEKYEEKNYNLSNMEEWFKDKPIVGQTVDFPNIPYLIDGNVKLSQIKAILSYLGRKHGLVGQNEEERIRSDVAMEAMSDMVESIIKIAYPIFPIVVDNKQEIHEKLLSGYEEQLPGKLADLSKFLKGHKWVAGDRLTYADFFVYDALDIHRLLFSSEYFDKEPALREYMARFEELKGVKEFLANPTFPHMPVYSQYAVFGHTKDFKPKPRPN